MPGSQQAPACAQPWRGAINLLPTPVLTADALVDALCRQLLPSAAAAARLSVQEAYQLLRTQLKQIPHLVVIDNLETVQDVEGLLAHLP